MAPAEDKTRIDLPTMVSPMLLAGDATTAYRDPAAIYRDGAFYLYIVPADLSHPWRARILRSHGPHLNRAQQEP